MDQHKKQNNPIISQINSSNKALQILVSLSVLAVIASQYSSLLSYLSSIKLLSYSTTDRHYIFLICNGIMLLVIKTSGFFASPSPPGTEFYRDSHVIRHHVQLSHHQSVMFRENIHVENNKKNNVKLQTDDLPETKAETNTNVVVELELEEAKGVSTVVNQGAELEEARGVSTTDSEKQEVNYFLDLVDEQYGHEEEEEHEIMLWSTEELNKKCDDFIRKMKNGLRNEAPLIMI